MKRRTFASCLIALVLTASVGTTASRKHVGSTHDKMCYFVFTPDEELICVDIP